MKWLLFPAAVLIRLDNETIGALDWLYRRLWNGRGMYVGTYRAVLLVAAFATNVAITILQAPRGFPDATIVGVLGILAAYGVVLGVILLPRHLGKEWTWQDQGRFGDLNALALVFASPQGFGFRALIALILCGSPLFASNPTWPWVLREEAFAIQIALWLASCAIIVEPRREPEANEIKNPAVFSSN